MDMDERAAHRAHMRALENLEKQFRLLNTHLHNVGNSLAKIAERLPPTTPEEENNGKS